MAWPFNVAQSALSFAGQIPILNGQKQAIWSNDSTKSTFWYDFLDHPNVYVYVYNRPTYM